MTEDDWNSPPVTVPAAGRGRGRPAVSVNPGISNVNANESWTTAPGSKPSAPQGANSSWDNSVYEGKPKPSPAPSAASAIDHSWDDPAPSATAGRGVTARMATLKVDNNNDDWGVPAAKSVPAGSEFPTPSVSAWDEKPAEQPRGASWGNTGGAPRGGGGGGGKGCHKCGQEGHMARDCPQAGGGGGGGSRACFKCNEEGHMSRDCPNPGSGGGGGPRTCHKCNQEGHISRDCPQGGGGGGGPRTCHKCGEEGHMSRECPSGGGGGGGNRACHKCGEEGHMSRECPQGGGGGSKACRKCGEEGHVGKDCPTGGPDKCFKCNEEGHMSRDCPKADGPPRPCFKCHSTEHQSKDCNEPVSAMTADGKPREQYTPEDIDDSELFKSGIASGNNFSNFDKVALQLTGDDVPQYIKSFEEAGLRGILLENIKASGYTKPTPVQRGAIPCIMTRRDVMACAVTGSGKTAAYLVPVINALLEKGVGGGMNDRCQKPEVLIIAPTRELATQIFNEARKFSNRSVLKTVIIYGGTVVSHQRQKLSGGCNILVATAGRLKGFIEDRCLDFSNIQFLILDEADRMLDAGFKDEILAVASHSTMPPPGKRQTLLFSATFPIEIQELAKQMTHNYVFVATGTVGGTNPDVNQDFFEVSKSTKRGVLEEELKKIGKARTIIFVESKKTADFLASYLCNAHFSATSIHGDRLQSQREQALRDFKSDRHNILVATNVAARGLDVPGVEYVINYELPKDVEEYVHRIGRTGRVGNVGRSISFFDPEYDAEKAGPIVEKLVASGAQVPPFLQSQMSGVGGMGYNFDAPSQGSGFGARDARTFSKPVEQEESWD